MSEMICAVCKQGKGPEKCEICGFSDDGAVNREFINAEDANYWLETVVKPYRRVWEARKREAELLALLEASRNNEKKLLGELEQMKAVAKERENVRPVLIDDKIGMEMVFVQGGAFMMGGTSEQVDAYDSEKPVHEVTLSDFYIGKYPVTQKQWWQMMGNNPSKFAGDNLPVERISWNDVQEFLSKLRSMTGKQYRMLTEAEWEFAARGGTKGKGYIYAGSNNLNDVGWYQENSGSKTHPVGAKQPNELGIYDMSGNVWEWVNDWYGPYSSSKQTNPTGPSSGSYRVARGGSWADDAGACRVSIRFNDHPGFRYYLIGFRLALSSP